MELFTNQTAYLGALPSPAKNRFFHGFPINEWALGKDQVYEDAKRWLLNRLTLGRGVLAGLAVSLLDAGKVEVKPGVAVDRFGREIVVSGQIPREARQFVLWPADAEIPKGYSVDAPTPDHRYALLFSQLKRGVEPLSRPEVLPASRLAVTGNGFSSRGLAAELVAVIDARIGNGSDRTDLKNSVELGWWAIKLAYSFSNTDPVRVGRCDCTEECAPTTIREEFKVVVEALDRRPDGNHPHIPNDEPAPPPQTPPSETDKVFPQEPRENVRHRYAAQCGPFAVDTIPPAEPPEDGVELGLAVLTLVPVTPGSAYKFELTVEPYYRQVFANDALSRLLFGLAERVDEAVRVRRLKHTDADSGDGQRGPVLRVLPKPLRVSVVDGGEGPVVQKNPESVRVRFRVLTPNGGSITTPQPVKVVNGVAEAQWQFGRDPGVHVVEARLEVAAPDKTAKSPFHPGDRLLFTATATPTAPTVGLMQFTDLIDERCRQWDLRPLLRTGFSRPMDQALLKTPDRWIRVLRKVQRPTEGRQVLTGPLQNVELTFVDATDVGSHTPGQQSTLATYSVPTLVKGLCPLDRLRVLVLIRASPDPRDPNTPFTGAGNDRQLLDADFSGSFLGPDTVESLWDAAPSFPALDQPHQQPNPPPIDDVPWEWLERREACLPSGDGFEGGWYHQVFEFAVQRVC
jgi:hypothetical protein